MRNQPKKFTRLLLAVSISAASFSLVACGGGDDTSDSTITTPADTVTKGAATYFASMTGNMTPTTVASWEATSRDDYVNQLQVDGDELLIIKQWYNGIAKVATNSNGATGDFVEFAALTTAGHGTESTDEDYVSGASEHKVLDSWYADDNSAMYALVNQPKGDTSAEDTAYGLFKVDLNEDGSTPFIERNGKKIYHEGAAVTRVGQDLKLTDALPLSDGRILALDEQNNAVAVYSTSLQLDQSSSFALNDNKIKQWVVNASGLFLLVEDKDKKVTLEKRSLDNLATVAKSVTVESASYLDTNDSGDYVVLAGGNSITLFDKELTKITTTTLINKAKGMSLSTDGKRIALTTEKDHELILLDIDQSEPALTSLQLESGFRRFEMGNKNTLFISAGKGDGIVQKISLTEKPVAMSANAVAELANSNITTETINHGNTSKVIRKDLDLPTASGQDITYQWTSSHDAVIDANGKVTQPAIGSSAVNVTLTLTTTATVAGQNATGTKTFNFTVLPQATIGTYDSSISLSDEAKKYDYREFTTNSNGSKVAGFARKKGKVLLIDTVTKNQTLVALPAGYEKADALAIAWKNDSTLGVFVAGKNTQEGTVFQLDANTNNVQEVGTLNKDTYKVYVSADKTTFSTLELAEDRSSCKTKTYSMSNMTQVATYPLSECEMYRLAVSNDGKVVYGSKHEHPSEGGDLNSIARYNEGTMDTYKYETGGFVYTWQQAGSKLLGGDRNGNFHVIDNAFTAGTLTQNKVKTIETARGGKVYGIDGYADKVVLMHSSVGLSIYKASGANYVEDKFIEDKHISRFVVSGDKQKGFAYDNKDKEINVLNLD